MSDLFAFNGAEGAGWSQPAPSLGDDDSWSTVPEALRRASPPAWPFLMSDMICPAKAIVRFAAPRGGCGG